MAKKEFHVGYKTINAKLKKTRAHLKKIRSQVTPKDQKDIDLQIKAMDIVIAGCVGRMTKVYTGK